jgi:biotin operon repressor
MQLTDLLEAIETLKNKGWKVEPPARKGRPRTMSETMTPTNRKRSLALKRAWKRRKAAA